MPTREQIQSLLEKEPNDPFLLYALAQDYAKANEHEDAITYYQRTLDADPEYCYAYFHMARSLQSLGRDDDAVRILDVGLESAKRINDHKAVSEISSLRTMFT